STTILTCPVQDDHVLFFMLVLILTAAANTAIYTLSLHDALPIFAFAFARFQHRLPSFINALGTGTTLQFFLLRLHLIDAFDLFLDRKSTRLNSSHVKISYAVFCLKKKKRDNLKNTNPRKTVVPGD